MLVNDECSLWYDSLGDLLMSICDRRKWISYGNGSVCVRSVQLASPPECELNGTESYGDWVGVIHLFIEFFTRQLAFIPTIFKNWKSVSEICKVQRLHCIFALHCHWQTLEQEGRRPCFHCLLVDPPPQLLRKAAVHGPNTPVVSTATGMKWYPGNRWGYFPSFNFSAAGGKKIHFFALYHAVNFCQGNNTCTARLVSWARRIFLLQCTYAQCTSGTWDYCNSSPTAKTTCHPISHHNTLAGSKQNKATDGKLKVQTSMALVPEYVHHHTHIDIQTDKLTDGQTDKENG